MIQFNAGYNVCMEYEDKIIVDEKKIPFDLIDEIEEARKWELFLMNSDLIHAMD